MESLLTSLKNQMAHFPWKERIVEGARKAAVIVPLFFTSRGLELLFVQRSLDLNHHAGQISFPGGGKDPDDKSLQDTALRELKEEINLHPEKVEILGRLSDHFTYVSNYLITPYVGYLNSLDGLEPDRSEITRFIQVPLNHLKNPQYKRQELWDWEGQKIKFSFYDYEDITIWGATGRILDEFLKIFD